MCIICASRINVRQPGEAAIRRMFANHPPGAGYMFARNGKVHIHKGYMDDESFLADIRAERFTAKDPVGKMKPFPATASQEKSHVRNWRSKGHLAPLMRPTKFP